MTSPRRAMEPTPVREISLHTRLGAVLAAVVVIGVTAIDDGGQHPTSGAAPVAVLLLLGVFGLMTSPRVARAGMLWLAFLTLAMGWTIASYGWTNDAGATVESIARLALYLSVVFCFWALLKESDAIALIMALALMIDVVCAIGLVTWSGGSRLAGPLGYWNAAGVLAAMGLVLNLGLAFSLKRVPLRAIAVLGVAVTGTTGYLTYSRGALVAATAGSAGLLLASRRWKPGRRTVVALLIGAAVVVLVAVIVGGGVEARFRQHSGSREKGPNPARLASVTGSGRFQFWRVAWDDFERHPLLGVGAGGWFRTWEQFGDARVVVPGAHNLYLETLAELGPVGVALLALALLYPVWIAWVRRGDTVVAAAFGAYVALLVHSAVDYDWQIPAVTATGIAAAAAIVHTHAPRIRIPLTGRLALTGLAIVLAVLNIGYGHGDQILLNAEHDLAHGQLPSARRNANRAMNWQPWSPAPLIVLGEADLALGNQRAARTILERATRTDPTNSAAWLALAHATSGRQRHAALVEAEHFAPLSPELKVTCKGATDDPLCAKILRAFADRGVSRAAPSP